MKYALIGCGRIATNHVTAAVNNNLEIVAVCDVVPEKMEAILEKHNLADDKSIKRYTDYKKMLEENDLELVSIATESGKHAAIALDAIDAGVNVIIEKPMSMNMADAEEIIKRAAEDQKNKGLEEETSNVYGNGHTSLFADVIEAIKEDRAPYVDGVAGRNALEMVLAIYKSQKEGAPVRLPLTDFASTDMRGEFK